MARTFTRCASSAPSSRLASSPWLVASACGLLGLASALTGCGSEAGTDEAGNATEVLEPVVQREEPPPPPPDRGPDGALLESDETLLGLRLPRGLRPLAVIEREHHYEGPYAPELYVRYLGPRLTTGTVERDRAGGARYERAVPRDVRGGAVVMDVTVAPGPAGTTLLTIIERPAVPENPPDEAETIRAVQRALQGELPSER